MCSVFYPENDSNGEGGGGGTGSCVNVHVGFMCLKFEVNPSCAIEAENTEF